MLDHGGRRTPARPPRRRRRRLYLAGLVGALALALGVVACTGGGGKTRGVASLGSSGQPTATTASSSNDRQMALNWARCMRQHGINLPDPQFSGDNIIQQLPARAVRNSAKFKAAEQACKRYLPNGGQPSPPSAQERQQALAFARCMRQHGIDIPDPQITANGIDQPLPRRMARDDPRLTAAEQACHQYGSLGPPKPGGPQSGGAGK
jgi:DNA-binding LacI/PurR family transcriptional regulator